MPVVLVVEDEAQVLVMAESILQESGYQAMTASTPAEALALMEPVQGRDINRARSLSSSAFASGSPRRALPRAEAPAIPDG
jgi:CheY-like chemotaxis protein